MTAKLHTIPEVCDLTGLHKVSANPVQWLTRQIKAGRFRARKVGRQWAMTDADIEFMLDRLANVTVTEREPVPGLDGVVPVGVSAGSLRRRRLA